MTDFKFSSGLVVLLALAAIQSVRADAPLYSVKASDNKTVCLLLQADISVDVKNNKTLSSQIPTDNSTWTTGECNGAVEVLNLHWLNKTAKYTLTLLFLKDGSRYKLANLTYEVADLPAISFEESGSASNAFGTDLNTTYKCFKDNEESFKDVTVTLKNLKVEAFRHNKTDMNFSKSLFDCQPKKTDVIVPIAVGAALGGMVLIVLIGYFIGRRRARAGYQQMNV